MTNKGLRVKEFKRKKAIKFQGKRRKIHSAKETEQQIVDANQLTQKQIEEMWNGS